MKTTPILLAALFLAPRAHAFLIDRKGNPDDVSPKTEQAICLGGGGEEDLWVEAWRWMLPKTGGGDVVVLCDVDYCADYQEWLLEDKGHNRLPKVNSVTKIEIATPEDANRPEVERAIRNAELVFFCGGDQSVYEDRFKNSKLLAAVNHVMKEKKVPVAGTSAGMAYLAGIDFTARYDLPDGSIIGSDFAMQEPMSRYIDLERGGLVAPFLDQVITDTHFSSRSRQGRLMTFMARATANGYTGIDHSKIKAIAADDGTGVCYDSSGEARVYGSGNAYFLRSNRPIERIGERSPEPVRGSDCPNCALASAGSAESTLLDKSNRALMEKPHSLDWYGDQQAVRVYVIPGKSNGKGASFNLKSWTGRGGSPEFWFVDGSAPGAPRFGMSRGGARPR